MKTPIAMIINCGLLAYGIGVVGHHWTLWTALIISTVILAISAFQMSKNHEVQNGKKN